MTTAEIAKQLLDKGETELAREVLAIEPDLVSWIDRLAKQTEKITTKLKESSAQLSSDSEAQALQNLRAVREHLSAMIPGVSWLIGRVEDKMLNK
jgi:phage shock protein A